MKKFIPFLIILLTNLFGIAQTWQWAQCTHDPSYCPAAISGFAVDGSGNSFITGSFATGITLGTTYASAVSGCFVAKYGEDGQFDWYQMSTSAAFGSVATDKAGNVLIAGYLLSSSATFGTTTLDSVNGPLCIIKYDSNGNLLWAKNFGAVFPCQNNQWTANLQTMCTDDSGNIYVGGEYLGDSLVIGNTIFSNGGASNFYEPPFFAKLDATGNPVWAKSATGLSQGIPTSLSADGNGNLIVGGTFCSNSITFDNAVLTSPNNPGLSMLNDLFLLKYSNTGQQLWAKNYGSEYSDFCTGVAVDGSGNIFMTGSFQGPTITFGDVTLTEPADPCSGDIGAVYTVKINGSGEVLWATQLNTTSAADGVLSGVVSHAIAADANGNSYISGGYVGGLLVVGPDSIQNAPDPVVGLCGEDMFVIKYDKSGNILWATGAGGNGGDGASGIALGNDGSVLVTGIFGETSFNFGNDTLTGDGGFDIFIAELSDPDAATNVTNILPANFEVYPNPGTGKFHLVFQDIQKSNGYIFNSLGQRVYEFQISGLQSEIDLSNLAPGIYFLRMQQENKLYGTSLVIQR